MSMSSPFRSSHRRTRSHSSLTTPSSSPVPRPSSNNRRSPTARNPLPDALSTSDHTAIACTSLSPFACPARTQPLEKWDVDMWRRGKRARREPSDSTPSDDADMESCDEPMILAWGSSAPSTPHFPSTSDAFQFFPPKSQPSSSPSDQDPQRSSHTHGAPSIPDGGLAQLHSDAFSDLRKTVSEAGEGFVRRMREFEARRSQAAMGAAAATAATATAGPSQSHAGARTSGAINRKAAHPKRGRKRPSPSSARHLAPPYGPHAENARAGDADDADSDVEILSSYAAARADDHFSSSPSKKRAVSLSAINGGIAQPQPYAHALPFPLPLRQPRQRSASPSDRMDAASSRSGSAYSDSSDEEDGGGVIVGRRRRLGPRSDAPSSVTSTTPPLSFSFSSASRNSSLSSLLPAPMAFAQLAQAAALRRRPASHSNSPSSRKSIHFGPGVPSARTASRRAEKAVAALSLALANGAGSVSDYEALRDARGVLAMEDSEAGSLWD